MGMEYLGIKVLTREFSADDGASARDFDFVGVTIGERYGIAVLGDKEDPRMFAIRLQITISNEEGKIAPYDVDIEIAGSFSISDKIPKENREDLVIVNGCSILYSAIRDQLMTISARCHHGALILPTVNFLDKIKQKEPNSIADKPRRKVSVTSRKKA